MGEVSRNIYDKEYPLYRNFDDELVKASMECDHLTVKNLLSSDFRVSEDSLTNSLILWLTHLKPPSNTSIRECDMAIETIIGYRYARLDLKPRSLMIIFIREGRTSEVLAILNTPLMTYHTNLTYIFETAVRYSDLVAMKGIIATGLVSCEDISSDIMTILETREYYDVLRAVKTTPRMLSIWARC